VADARLDEGQLVRVDDVVDQHLAELRRGRGGRLVLGDPARIRTMSASAQ
jgi:hypothetical protein